MAGSNLGLNVNFAKLPVIRTKWSLVFAEFSDRLKRTSIGSFPNSLKLLATFQRKKKFDN